MLEHLRLGVGWVVAVGAVLGLATLGWWSVALVAWWIWHWSA